MSFSGFCQQKPLPEGEIPVWETIYLGQHVKYFCQIKVFSEDRKTLLIKGTYIYDEKTDTFIRDQTSK